MLSAIQQYVCFALSVDFSYVSSLVHQSLSISHKACQTTWQWWTTMILSRNPREWFTVAHQETQSAFVSVVYVRFSTCVLHLASASSHEYEIVVRRMFMFRSICWVSLAFSFRRYIFHRSGIKIWEHSMFSLASVICSPVSDLKLFCHYNFAVVFTRRWPCLKVSN